MGAPARQGESRYGPCSISARSVGAYPSSIACSSWARPTPSRWSKRMRRPEGRALRACRPRPATGRRTWRTSPWTSRDLARASTSGLPLAQAPQDVQGKPRDLPGEQQAQAQRHEQHDGRGLERLQALLRGLGQAVETLPRLLAKGVGDLARDLLRLPDGPRNAQRKLGPDRTVVPD